VLQVDVLVPTDEVELTILHGIRHCQNFFDDLAGSSLAQTAEANSLAARGGGREELLPLTRRLGRVKFTSRVFHNQC